MRAVRLARPLLPIAALLGLLAGGCGPAARQSRLSAAPMPASCLAATPAGSAAAAPSAPGGPAAALSVPGSAVRSPAWSASGVPGAVAIPVPDLALPCLRGTGSARLRALGGPLVINLWASWCTPCRTEMPAVQRYSVRARGMVGLIGVDTMDTSTGGASVIDDLGITYPNLSDDRRQLLTAVGRVDLPVTLFVDAQGTIRYEYSSSQALTESSLARLVRTYLGVAS